MERINWTREQTIIAFNVYCKIPFKDSSSKHPEIIRYAKIIGRSPSALNMKIGNFGRLDPQLSKRGITGLSHGSKLEEDVWDEFHGNWDGLIYESEALLAKFQNEKIENIFDINLSDLPQGKERESIVKSRVNQKFFRTVILSSYDQRCCITGLPLSDLLIASHIIPWHKNKEERLNPRNGLSLNALHDRAFDRGLITISTDYKVVISNYIKEFEMNSAMQNYFIKFHNKGIYMPDKFPPKKAFLEYHNDTIFKK